MYWSRAARVMRASRRRVSGFISVNCTPACDCPCCAAHTMRLAYSFVSPDEIETGIERLAAAV